MVSNARLLFPEPDNPVNTTKRSRGISMLMFFKLCSRAPLTMILGAEFLASGAAAITGGYRPGIIKIC